jgi:hypothetical protein
MLTLRGEGTTVVDIAHALHSPTHELNAFISGFATLPVEGGGQQDVQSVNHETPSLTVIEGGSGHTAP